MHAPPRTTSTLAIVSLVFGILGWTLLPFVGCIVAVITGHLARGSIRRSAEPEGGDGMAIAGLILGYAGIALGVLSVIALVMLFGGIAWLSTLG